MFLPKRPRRHAQIGIAYQISVAVLFVSAIGLTAMHPVIWGLDVIVAARGHDPIEQDGPLEGGHPRCREAMLAAGSSVRRWCPVSNTFMAAPLSSSIA
jgi:hypothetical protein